jgi:hypothetical protein
MLLIITQTNSSLAGQLAWSIGDPSFGGDIGEGSRASGDSVFLRMINDGSNELLVVLHGRVSADTINGSFEKKSERVPLYSVRGNWRVMRNP